MHNLAQRFLQPPPIDAKIALRWAKAPGAQHVVLVLGFRGGFHCVENAASHVAVVSLAMLFPVSKIRVFMVVPPI